MHKGSMRTGLLLFLEEMEQKHGGMAYRLEYKQSQWPGFPNKTWLEIITRMIKDGEVKTSKNTIGLTNAGRARVYALQPARIHISKRWDGRWRMVTFEIPEKKRVKRNQLRNLLIDIGFGRWQKSLYIHAFPLMGFVKDYAEQLGVMQYMTSWEARIAGTYKNLELVKVAFPQDLLIEAGKKLITNAKAISELEGYRQKRAQRRWMGNWQEWVFADPMLPRELVAPELRSLKSELLELVGTMVVGD